MKVLFICGKARMRSPTAADVASGFDDVQTDFAGLSADADERVSSEHLDWADVIYVMERRQKKRLAALFPDFAGKKKVRVLDIPDRFAFMDPELVDILSAKLSQLNNG